MCNKVEGKARIATKKKETLKGQGTAVTYIKKDLEMNRYEQILEG